MAVKTTAWVIVATAIQLACQPEVPNSAAPQARSQTPADHLDTSKILCAFSEASSQRVLAAATKASVDSKLALTKPDESNPTVLALPEQSAGASAGPAAVRSCDSIEDQVVELMRISGGMPEAEVAAAECRLLSASMLDTVRDGGHRYDVRIQVYAVIVPGLPLALGKACDLNRTRW
jgi:hypothetical protein